MMWTEDEGRRGAVEVCSSILEFLSKIETCKYSKVMTFSDSCGGQNKNKAIIAMFMYACKLHGIESWEHQYLESGHSYLPNDRDFGIISRKSKYASTVYNLFQWIDVVTSAQKKTPFKVTKMAGKFRDIEKLPADRKFNNLETNAPQKFNFLKMKWFRKRKESDIVEYKTSESSDIFP